MWSCRWKGGWPEVAVSVCVQAPAHLCAGAAGLAHGYGEDASGWSIGSEGLSRGVGHSS